MTLWVYNMETNKSHFSKQTGTDAGVQRPPTNTAKTRTAPKLGWTGMVKGVGFRGPQAGLAPMGAWGAGGLGGVP